METVCFCSELFFSCWKPLPKFLGTNFKRKTFLCRWKTFSLIFLSEKKFFRVQKTYFSMNASFRVVETDFLASANHFCIFCQRLLPEKGFFRSSGNLFLNKSFIPAIGDGYFSLMKTATLLESFFLPAETVTTMSGNQFL